MLKNITLEMSLKPFKQTDGAYIAGVCQKVFEQWKPLVRTVPCVSVLLWTADGSELLDYKRDMEEPFDWGRYVGGANNCEGDHRAHDPAGTGLHSRCYLYMENPPEMTYGILRRIVSALKETGRAMLPGKTIRVGTAFDPGPEFAKSPFKYERHKEICLGNDMGAASMVCSYARLTGDTTPYAGFPDGIPDGLPFGIFFGRQANLFLSDMGFDYLWLSNGFGFGRETWSATGAVFDGRQFHTEAMPGVKREVQEFWDLFRQECPDFPIETRGTNLSAGIDLASDGVPLWDIYRRVPGLLPPPNSPWAALNGDFGLELMGHMSRIAELPGEDYPFRYYIHDPWWANSPWYDRYGGQPHDIYLPLSISRIDENGAVQPPTHMNLLSIDNSFGDLPDACVNETIPHLLKALKDAPDDAAPVVWVYPFREYAECTAEDGAMDMFSGDWFIRGAVNSGLPLSQVVSTDNFLKTDRAMYMNSVLVTPVPLAGSLFEQKILAYLGDGGKVIFYGSTRRAGKPFLNRIGVKNGDTVSGELALTVCGRAAGVIRHQPLLCGGGITEELAGGKPFVTIGTKTAGTFGENFVWLRGTCSCDYIQGSSLLVPHQETTFFIGESLMLRALAMLGFSISFARQKGVKPPVLMLHRSDNAYLLSCYSPSTTVRTKMRFPLGAPLLMGYEAQLENGCAVYHFPKADHREIRAFVVQEDGIAGCRELPPVSMEYRRRIEVFGLRHATVRFFAEACCKENIHVVLNSKTDFYAVGDAFEGHYVTQGNLTYYEAADVTGSMVFSMPFRP